jgi:organic radical activating enzyme
MSLSDIETVIEWLTRQNIRHISLAGGEPTFYSKFKEMVPLFKKHNIKISLLTNALFSKDIQESIDPTVISECCINIDPKDTYSEGQFELLDRNIKLIREKIKEIHLSYNISKSNLDYKYYLDACERYGINKIRFSLVAPNKSKNNDYILENELKSYVPIMIEFVKEAVKSKYELILDFPMPYCIFSSTERDFLKKKAGLHGKCSSGVDFITINPDKTVFACAPLLIKGPDITTFFSINQVHDYFRDATDSLRWNKFLFTKCKSCLFRRRKECQGGCLCYKE